MRDLILLATLALVFAALPFWAYNRGWGYAPAGGFLLVAFFMLVQVLSGRSYG